MDLFKTKKDQVLDYIISKKWAKTSDIIRFGLSIYHTRADRDARDLRQEGKIYRMRDDLKSISFGPIKEDIYTTRIEEADNG